MSARQRVAIMLEKEIQTVQTAEMRDVRTYREGYRYLSCAWCLALALCVCDAGFEKGNIQLTLSAFSVSFFLSGSRMVSLYRAAVTIR